MANVTKIGKMTLAEFSARLGSRMANSLCGGLPFRSVPENLTALPGFCDVHVHFREPGFSYKETIASGSASAARGGVTAVCAMPNLNPVPDSAEHLEEELSLIRRDAKIAVYPYASLTVGEKGERIADLAATAAAGAIAFSDDGKGIRDGGMMRELMARAKELGKIVAAHCEDLSLVRGGYIHDGSYAISHGHAGICSESEWRPIERDLRLAEETGCAYHVCHISTKESVELIRQAKKSGIDVTCETAPHYLVLNEWNLRESGRFKMNPPIRQEADRLALLEGITDGTIDMIATDHAPHAASEKAKGLRDSAFGVVGLETSFPVLYTHLVRNNVITLDRLTDLMAWNPRERFSIPYDGSFSLWDLNREFTVDPEEFLSLGRATPFEGERFFGVNQYTVYNDRVVYQNLAQI